MPDYTPPNSLSRRGLLKALAFAGAAGTGGAVAVNALAPLVLPEDRVFTTNQSYWSRALPPPNAALASDLEADVAIIGGGFTGLSSAYYLAKTLPGRRIVLLEARACGNGASGRNGGMVLNLKDRDADPALARRLYDLTLANIRTLREMSAATGVDCELEQNGALTVLRTEAEAQEASATTAGDGGLPIVFWDRQRTAAAIGTHAYTGALFDPGAGQVHPGKLVSDVEGRRRGRRRGNLRADTGRQRQ